VAESEGKLCLITCDICTPPFISYAYDPYVGTICVFTEELSSFPSQILWMSIVFYKTKVERLQVTLRVTKTEKDFRRVTISTLTLLISIFMLTLLIMLFTKTT
jgi:hypothetical protein